MTACEHRKYQTTSINVFIKCVCYLLNLVFCCQADLEKKNKVESDFDDKQKELCLKDWDRIKSRHRHG
jgi:hypothetical protein